MRLAKEVSYLCIWIDSKLVCMEYIFESGSLVHKTGPVCNPFGTSLLWELSYHES